MIKLAEDVLSTNKAKTASIWRLQILALHAAMLEFHAEKKIVDAFIL